MQKNCITFLLCLCWTFTYSQYFSGEIQYKSTIIDKETGQIMKVHTSTLIIGDGFYRKRQNTQNDLLYETTYIEKEGKLYSQRGNNPYITYEILNPVEGDYTPYKIYKDSTDNVLGQEVFLGVKRFPKMIEKNYYSNSIRVNPDDYAGYCTGRKNDHLKQLEGRLPLKTISNYDDYDFIAIREAVKIKKKRLRPRDMQFPKGMNIAARSRIVENPENMYNFLTNEQVKCYEDNTMFTKNYSDAIVKKVRLKFIYTTQKQIKDITVYKSDDPALNDQAITILNSCKFDYILGIINNKPVDTEIYQEMSFYFDREETDQKKE